MRQTNFHTDLENQEVQHASAHGHSQYDDQKSGDHLVSEEGFQHCVAQYEKLDEVLQCLRAECCVDDAFFKGDPKLKELSRE